jgi:hypothetical protein
MCMRAGVAADSRVLGVVLGAHAAYTRARVFAPSMLEPRILVMYGFIVSIQGLVLTVTLTMYLCLGGRPGRWLGILGFRFSPVRNVNVALTTPRLNK